METPGEGKITADSIIQFFTDAVESKKALNPQFWLDGAMKLNVLLIDEESALHEMRRVLAQKKVELLDKMEKRNVSEAEIRIEATEEYEKMKVQQSKCDRINEFILLAKANARTALGFN